MNCGDLAVAAVTRRFAKALGALMPRCSEAGKRPPAFSWMVVPSVTAK